MYTMEGWFRLEALSEISEPYWLLLFLVARAVEPLWHTRMLLIYADISLSTITCARPTWTFSSRTLVRRLVISKSLSGPVLSSDIPTLIFSSDRAPLADLRHASDPRHFSNLPEDLDFC